MIIRNVFVFNADKVYQNYSDNNVYIRNKTNGTLWTSVNSNIDFEYEETDIPIEQEENINEN
jgi:ribosomal protein L16 Arg81 hydroxylase